MPIYSSSSNVLVAGSVRLVMESADWLMFGHVSHEEAIICGK